MATLVDYRFDGDVATIHMDDGKANALSPAMLKALNKALDQAERDGAPVVLRGREGVFCGGFDLKVMQRGGVETLHMIRAGFLLAARLLDHPQPVIAACDGHAIAMGAFLLLGVDERIGVRGPFKVVTNEVAIGLTMPFAAIELCRLRLSPSQFQRALILAQDYSPEDAITAGFLDQVVDPAALKEAAYARARATLRLDAEAHTRTKRRCRRATINAIRRATWLDMADLAWQGVKIAGQRRRRAV